VTRGTDQPLVLRFAEAQRDLAVGQRSIGWRQLDPTTLDQAVSRQPILIMSVVRINIAQGSFPRTRPVRVSLPNLPVGAFFR